MRYDIDDYDDLYDLDYCIYCTARMRVTDPFWPYCSKRCELLSESEDADETSTFERRETL